jgi:hypothetical protein
VTGGPGRGHETALPLSSPLLPIDKDTARSCRCDADTTLRLAAQPLQRAFVVAEETLERDETMAIVLTQPILLLLAEHVLEHHACLDGHARQPLETKPALVWVRVLGVHVADDEDGFDPDAEIVLFICCVVSEIQERGSGGNLLLTITRFVGEDVTAGQRNVA